MATIFYRQALIGGGETALDAQVSSGISDGDLALTVSGNLIYAHKYDATSDAAETSPGVIVPDDAPATGRWIQQVSPFDTSPVPTGTTILWDTSETPPDGFLEKDGSAISRTTYSGLFALMGTQYGAGDGVNTFNLPDDRGETPIGWDHGRGVDAGRVLGSWAAGEVMAHTHVVPNRTWSGSGGFASAAPNEGGAGGITTVSQNPAGSVENKVRSRAYMFCVKY